MQKQLPDITPKGMSDFLSGREKTKYTPEEIKAGAEAYNRIMGDMDWNAPTIREK